VNTAEELIGRARGLGIHLWVSGGNLNFRAPPDTFPAELRNELQANKASIIDALSGPRYERTPHVSAVDVPDSYVSRWNRARTGIIGVGYTNVTNKTWRFRRPIDLDAMERALHRLTRQHNALRCRLADDGAALRLVFDCDPELTTVDLSRLDSSAVEGAIRSTAQEIAWQPFSPGACLFRPFALKLPSSGIAMGFVAHHFIVDGWSFGRIPVFWLGEYERQLQSRSSSAGIQDCLQYSDYLLGISRWSKSLNFQRRLEFWRENLRGVASSRLPPDYAVDPDTRSIQQSMPLHLDSDRVRGLTKLAASIGVTLSDVLTAGIVLALQRELKSSDISLRHYWHGRDEPRLFSMIGNTLNPVILRIRSNPADGLRDVARQVHRVAAEAISKQVPRHYADTILDESGDTALVQTNFRLRMNVGDPGLKHAPGLSSIEPVHVWNPNLPFSTPRDLPAHDINLTSVNDTVSGEVAYLEDVYEDETMRRFILGFEQALTI